MQELLLGYNDTASVLLTLAVILLSGFIITRFTKFIKLPNVTGYIIAGVIIGPYVLHIVHRRVIEHMGFVSDIALAFIAFSIGKFFKRKIFKELGFGVIITTLLESILAGMSVTLSLHFIFKLDYNICLLLGAIATATAPASTMMTIRQYHAKGKFINLLLQIVAFDDVICLFIFSIVAAFVGSDTASNVKDIIMPVIYNIAAILIGFIAGFLLSKLITPSRSKDNRLIITIMLLLGITGCCSAVNISPLLSCMVFSATYVNVAKDKKLYKEIGRFVPPVLSIFFIISGMNLDINSFKGLGIIGICYFLIRIIGKYLGAYFGCLFIKASKTIRNNLGLALIPQAGVAIGLAFLGKRMLSNELGNMLLTIILASSVLYELIGPLCAKIAIINSGSTDKK